VESFQVLLLMVEAEDLCCGQRNGKTGASQVIATVAAIPDSLAPASILLKVRVLERCATVEC